MTIADIQKHLARNNIKCRIPCRLGRFVCNARIQQQGDAAKNFPFLQDAFLFGEILQKLLALGGKNFPFLQDAFLILFTRLLIVKLQRPAFDDVKVFYLRPALKEHDRSLLESPQRAWLE